jgi:sugar/nucleoside kinase (ribokinase family)
MTDLGDRLASFDPGRVLACPDGSVDSYVHVHDAGGRVTNRSAFGDRVEAGDRSFRLDPQWHEPGGQSVNMAVQAHALGADTVLYGHCDDPVFDLPFEVISLGLPARVTICDFTDGDLMLAEEPADLQQCDDETLRAAGAFDETPAAICLANWSTVHGVVDILQAFAESRGTAPIVLDPGSLSGLRNHRAVRFRDALSACSETRPVVVSANRAETRGLLGALELSGTIRSALPELRSILGVEGFVVHAAPETLAATPADLLTVETSIIEDPATNTGGGDRFSAAVACALADGWDLYPALELANAVAGHFIRTGETPTVASLRASL